MESGYPVRYQNHRVTRVEATSGRQAFTVLWLRFMAILQRSPLSRATRRGLGMVFAILAGVFALALSVAPARAQRGVAIGEWPTYGGDLAT